MKKLLIISFIICSFSLFSQTQYFPVLHRIVNNNAGTGVMQDATLIPLIMEELNRVFAPAGIQFYTYCDIDTNIFL